MAVFAQRAAQDYRAAGQREFEADTRDLLLSAAKSWEVALPRVAPADMATIHANLTKVHTRLALIAAEERETQMQQHHIGQLAHHAAGRFRALHDDGVWEKAVRGLLLTMRESPLTFDTADSILAKLGERMQECDAPLAPRASVDAERLVRLQKKACLLTSGCDEFAQSESLPGCCRGGGLPAELKPWLRAIELVTKAARLRPVGRVSEDCGGPTAQEVEDAVELASFVFHRGSFLLRLHQAGLNARTWLLEGSDVPDRDDGFEVLDEMVDVVEVARVARDVPKGLLNKVDVEMSCISRYHLGKLYGSLGMPEQQAKRFRESVELAMTFDPSGIASAEWVIDGRSRPDGALFRKPWFRAVTEFLRKRQSKAEAAARDAEDEQRQQMLSKLKGPMAELAKHGDVRGLVNHLVATYGVNQGLTPIRTDESVSKATYMKVLLAFHPDKQLRAPDKWESGLAYWQAFCTEITKKLNYHYELHFKCTC